VFPVNSPNVEKVEIDRVSQVMRARLYYLRDRIGKKAVQVKVERRAMATAS
jgi:large subunit ribosomal protein L19